MSLVLTFNFCHYWWEVVQVNTVKHWKTFFNIEKKLFLIIDFGFILMSSEEVSAQCSLSQNNASERNRFSRETLDYYENI